MLVKLGSALLQFSNAINAVSVAKVAYPLKETFIKAIMANWSVAYLCTSGITLSSG